MSKGPDSGDSHGKDLQVTRRDALKLASAVASLGAGLGVVFTSHEGAAATAGGAEGGRLQFKFWKVADGGDQSQAELLATFQPTPEEEARIAAVPQGRLQLKLSIAQVKMAPGTVVQGKVTPARVVQAKVTPGAAVTDDWEARAEKENDGGVTRVILVKQILPLDTSRLEIKTGRVQIKVASASSSQLGK